MSREMGRSVLQVALVCLLLLGFLGGLGCWWGPPPGVAGCAWLLMFLSCGSGSTHSSSSALDLTHHAAWLDQGARLVGNWHDFNLSDVTLTSKDLGYLKDWAPDHDLVIGLRVPRAPGASAPGVLVPDTPVLDLWHDGGQREVVDLAPSEDHAAQIAAMLPPGPEARWQALTPADDTWLNLLPDTTTTLRGLSGSLFYALDFGRDDPCNGCEVQLTFCAETTLSPAEQLLARAYLGRPVYSANGLTCTEPVPSYLVLSDHLGRVVPGIPFVAAFGLWGGNIISGTTAATIRIPYHLEHTSPVTQTFDLQPIHSERGWTYTWAAMNGSPISRLQVGPLPVPIWDHRPPNVQVIGTGLPPCAHLLDTIAVTATHVTTPTVQAATVTQVQVYPDPAVCPVADVGVSQVASSGIITAGQRVTFTLTVTNYETVAVTARVTDTLSPAQAVQGATLPAGCTRSGGQITCPAVNLAAGGSRALAVGVSTRSTFGGVLSSWAEADPAAATDVAHYDNDAGPVDVTVVRVGGGQIALPLLLRDRSQ